MLHIPIGWRGCLTSLERLLVVAGFGPLRGIGRTRRCCVTNVFVVPSCNAAEDKSGIWVGRGAPFLKFPYCPRICPSPVVRGECFSKNAFLLPAKTQKGYITTTIQKQQYSRIQNSYHYIITALAQTYTRHLKCNQLSMKLLVLIENSKKLFWKANMHLQFPGTASACHCTSWHACLFGILLWK